MPPIPVKSMRAPQERARREESASRFHLPQPVQLAPLVCPGRPDRALPSLRGALVGAIAGHLLPGRALLAGDGPHRILELQVLPGGPAEPGALPAGGPEPPGAESLLRDRDRGLQPDQAGRGPRHPDHQAGGAARRRDVRVVPLPAGTRGVDRTGGALRDAGKPAVQPDAPQPASVWRQRLDVDRTGVRHPATHHHRGLPPRPGSRPAAPANLWLSRPAARAPGFGVSGAASCLITLTTGGGPADQVIEVGEGVDPSVHGKPLTHVSPGLVTQVVIERRPVFSEDIQLDGRFPLDPLAQRYGWRAALGLPMLLGRVFVGTVSVYFHELRAFDPTLMQVLQILANQAAVALDNARRFQRERQTIEMLQRANLELQEADRMKSEFLTNMSHELRTPLNAIIGFSEIIRTTPELSDDERNEFAGTIHTSGRRLLKLINDILELTHIQAGRLELHPAPCLLAEAVDAALSENAAAATQKDLTVTSRVERSLQVVFDPRSLRHVVHNLVNNAVKFTPHHGSVVISAAESDAGTVVEVRDTGIGIKREDQARLFEEFRQVDGSTSRGYEGVGLGLALSKRLVELQGGQIWVESTPGKGSAFRFLIRRIPLLAQTAGDQPIGRGPLPRVA